MKKFTLKNAALLILFLFSFTTNAQIGGAFTVPGNFPTIAAAINTLNVQGVAAAVTINIAAGYSETAVTGGYRLYDIPGASATNSVVFRKSGAGVNPIVYAYSGGVASASSTVQDGVWWFIGTDYTTVDGIDIVDQNPAGTALMEFGFAFFKAGATNGCQYNTIKNSSITLNRSNSLSGTGYMFPGSKGILISCGTPTANTTALAITAASGSNSYNKIYGNTIRNCHIGICLSGYFNGALAVNDSYNDVGGYSTATGNTILNFGGGSVNDSYGIYTYRQFFLNVSNNVLINNDGSGIDHQRTLSGIYTDDAADASLSINNNTITLRGSAGTNILLQPILNQAGAGGTSNTITISKNIFPSYTYTNSGFSIHQLINCNASGCRRVFIDSNVINNVTIGNGTLSAINVTSPTEIYIRADTIRNVTGFGVRFNGIQFTGTQSTTKINNNLIENINWSSAGAYSLYGISGATSYACEIVGNTIRNINYSSSGNVFGIAEISGNTSSYKLIGNNQIYNFDNLSGSSGPTNITGIRLSNTSLCSPEVYSNSIYSLKATTTAGGASGLLAGIDISGGTTIQIYKNKVAGLSSTYGSDITGMLLAGPSSNYLVFNNLVGTLGFPNADVTRVSGLTVTTGTCTLYYNTMYLNVAHSNDPDFSSNVVRQATTTGGLKMNNNILVNTSVVNGTGKTIVLQRSTSSLTGYSVSSNNNLMYAGVPSATNAIYDDYSNSYSGITAFKTAVGPREALSVTENPPFITTIATATNYLNLDPALPTQAEGLAQVILGYPTDYTGTVRNTSTPDIGAWEGNFMQADIVAPTVVASGFLGGNCSLTGRTFTVQFTDATGIATGSLAPRLYHRVNLGLYTSIQGTLTSGTATNGIWSFDLSYTANTNDVIRYFFAAQDASSLSNYSLFPSAGSTSGDVNNVTIPPPAPYTYTVMAPVNVSVNSGVLCTGSSYTLVPSGATTYTISGGSAVVNPTSNTSYTITGSGVAGCVTSSVAIASITVVPLPTISVSSGTTCSNQAFTISPTGTSSYSYQGGSAVVNPPVTTSYSVYGVDLNGCLSNTLISTVTVFAAPALSVNTTYVCEGVPSTIIATGATNYTWSANAGGGTSSQVVISPTLATVYTLSGSNANCISVYPFTININPTPVFSISSSGPTLSCSSLTLTANTSTGGIWAQKTSFPANSRYEAIAFSIGSTGYMGTGYNYNLSPAYRSDFWAYNSLTNTWTQKADFAGGQRAGAVGFSIGSKGYVGTGGNSTVYYYDDFWEYDPAANTWIPKASVGGGPRVSAVGMAIGNKGYIGTGYRSVISADANDFWEYDPLTNSWLQRTNFPGAGREGASCFAIGTKGYLGTGNVSSAGTSDFYEFDPSANTWTGKATFGGGLSLGVVGLSLGNRGYFITGTMNSSSSNQNWEYNPVSNTWTRREDFGAGYTRTKASGFAIGLKAYIVNGITLGNFTSDLWEYEAVTTLLWSNGITQKTISPLSSGIYSVVVTNAYNCSASASQSVGIQTYPTVTVTNSGGIICSAGTRTLTAAGAASYTWSANLGGSNSSSVVITPTASNIYTVSSANGWCVTRVSVVQEVILPATQSIVVAGSSVACGASITLSTAATSGNIWTQRTSMSMGRSRGISFSIADKAYVGTGFNSTNTYLGDFWEYDPATNAWTQKANFGGSARYGAVGLSIGGSGFVGTGYDGTYKNDFWQYDPIGNTWTQKNDFGGGTRRYGTSFVINGKAYLGTGQSQFGGAYLDLWEYNPAADSWLQKTSLGGGLYDAVGFSIGSKGYICSGSDAGNTPGTGLREFDPVTNAWTTRTAITSQRSGAAAFTIGTKAYVTGGTANNDVWEYNQVTNAWTARATFAGPQRPNAVAFAIANKGYIATGGTSFLNDVWEYDQGYTINWTGGATTSSIIAATSGNYSLTLTDTRGCSTLFTQSLSITPGITIVVSGPNSSCLNAPVTLTANGAASYTWSANAGNATTNTVSVNPTVNTVYTLNASANSCTATITKSITVNGLPTVTVSVPSSTVCEGISLTLNGGGASSYSWSAGGGGNVTNNTAFTPSVSQSFTVTGTDVNGCSNTATASVVVKPSPTVSVNSGSVCAGQSFTLIPNGALTYTYSGGGTAVVTPASTSNYSVTGFSSNGCFNAIPAVATITVNALPVITLTNNSICTGNSFVIIPGGAASYTYSSGSATVTPTSNTSYSVTGTSSAGCISSAVSVINVSVNPIPTISVSGGSVCQGQSFTLMPSGALTYSYSSGSAVVNPLTTTSYSVAGTSSLGCVSSASAVATVAILASPTVAVGNGTVCSGQSFILIPTGGSTYTYSGGSATVTPLSTTVYTITGYGSNGCPNTGLLTSTVQVNALPAITAGNGTLCAGASFTITPGGAASYTFSGGSNVVSPLTTTSYSITGTGTNSCVSSLPVSVTVTVYSLPSVSITGASSICQGATQIFTATGASSYTWNTGSISNTLAATPLTATTYSVKGTDVNGCINTAQHGITFSPSPTLALTGNTIICEGQSASLQASGTALTFTWTTGATGNAVSVSPIVSSVFTATGSNLNGCTGTATILVFVNSAPSVSFNASGTSVCIGNPVTLSGSGASTYTWSGGVSNNVAFHPSATHIYFVTGTDANSCSKTATVQISVNPLPVIKIISPDTICAGETLVLAANGANTYLWGSGETNLTITVTPSVNAVYSLTGTDINNCTATFSRTLAVSECVGLKEISREYGVQIYPNPGNGLITIQLKDKSSDLRVEVYTSLSQLISAGEINSSFTQLDLSNYAQGVYFLRITRKGSLVHQEKIIKAD